MFAPGWLARETTLYPEFSQPFLWIGNLGLPEFAWANFPHQLPISTNGAPGTSAPAWHAASYRARPSSDGMKPLASSANSRRDGCTGVRSASD